MWTKILKFRKNFTNFLPPLLTDGAWPSIIIFFLFCQTEFQLSKESYSEIKSCLSFLINSETIIDAYLAQWLWQWLLQRRQPVLIPSKTSKIHFFLLFSKPEKWQILIHKNHLLIDSRISIKFDQLISKFSNIEIFEKNFKILNILKVLIIVVLNKDAYKFFFVNFFKFFQSFIFIN